MKLLFKQRFFSWFDSYDIYYEDGSTAYTVGGKLAWGHKLVISDPSGNEVGMLREVIFSWFPRFEFFINGNYVGSVKKEFSFFRPRYNVDFKSWSVVGNFWEWDYEISSPSGHIASVSKKPLNFTDTYQIDVSDPSDALGALLVVLAIDAEKCTRSNT